MNEEPLGYTIARASEVSGYGRTTLYGLIGAGEIEARKIGNRTIVVGASLRAHIANLPRADIRGGRNKVQARSAA